METKTITTAIIAVMKEVNNIEKNTTVWKWNSSYKAVSDADVKRAIRDSMIKNNLAILPTSVEWKKQIERWEEEDSYSKSVPKAMKTKQSVFTEVHTKYILLHTSWESIQIAWYGQWVDTQDKGAGKATTYALKNALISLFLIPTWEDTDNTHSDDIDVPQTKTEYKGKFDLMDYITRIKEETDSNALETIKKEFIEEKPSEKQEAWFMKELSAQKEELNVGWQTYSQHLDEIKY